tara:strand:- start:143 stop:733 length:591 start_codon:yes stop_codon:yes gene_type:complete
MNNNSCKPSLVNKATVNSLKQKAGDIAGAISKKKNMIFIMLIVIGVLIGITYYIYTTFISGIIKDSNDIAGNGGVEQPEEPNTVNLYFLYAKWCPFSKKTKPIFESVATEWEKKGEVNGYTLTKYLIEEKDSARVAAGSTTEAMTEIMYFEDKYLGGKQIEGYPSIFVVKNGTEVIEYNAKINKVYLNEFIKQVMK